MAYHIHTRKHTPTNVCKLDHGREAQTSTPIVHRSRCHEVMLPRSRGHYRLIQVATLPRILLKLVIASTATSSHGHIVGVVVHVISRRWISYRKRLFTTVGAGSGIITQLSLLLTSLITAALTLSLQQGIDTVEGRAVMDWGVVMEWGVVMDWGRGYGLGCGIGAHPSHCKGYFDVSTTT